MIARVHGQTNCYRTNLTPLLGGLSGVKEPPTVLARSVGRNGANQAVDVKKVQHLLNRIAPEDGGPEELLKEDGFIGPITTGAIHKFQQHHKTASDDKVDPGGPTLAKMNEVAGSRDPELTRLLTDVFLRLRTAASLQQIRDTARKGLRTAELATDHLSLGLGDAKPWRLAALHFSLDKIPKSKALAALADIQVTFRRVNTVLNSRPSITGGDPFGFNIFEVDKTDTPHIAYSPMQAGEPFRKEGEPDAGHVYLGAAAMRLVPDHFEHVLLHEVLHFVDDENAKHLIVDHGYRDRAMQLPHDLRMHNSDNYALFASHAFLGRARLVASQPDIAPFIPADL